MKGCYVKIEIYYLKSTYTFWWSNSTLISSETFFKVFTELDMRSSWLCWLFILWECELSISATNVDVPGRDVNNTSSWSSVSLSSKG